MQHTDQFADDFHLRDEARDLGINKVVILQENDANAWIPDYIAERIIADFPVSDNFWTKFYFPEDSVVADIEAKLILTDVEVGPESVRRENIERSRRIEDGWDYVLDANGNVAKDSTGNDIKNVSQQKLHLSIHGRGFSPSKPFLWKNRLNFISSSLLHSKIQRAKHR